MSRNQKSLALYRCKYILLYVSKPFFYQSIAGTATSHDAADCGGLVSRSGKSGQTTDAWVKFGPPWCLESPRSFARRRLALDAEPSKSPFASPRVGTQRTFYGAVTAPRANKSDHHKCEIVRGQELLRHPRSI